MSEVNFFDPATNKCPYGAYSALRAEAPVWLDPRTGMYVVTRYDDVRKVLLDTDAYGNGRRPRERDADAGNEGQGREDPSAV